MAKVEIVNETETKVSVQEARRLQKQAQKESEKQRKWENTMITRGESYAASQQIAQQVIRAEAQSMVDYMREPLQVSLLQIMALSELLMEKGIITHDEYQAALDKVAEKAESSMKVQAQEVEAVDESEKYGETKDGVSFPNKGNEEERYAEQAEKEEEQQS